MNVLVAKCTDKIDDLFVLNGVRFTKREVDTLSCVIHGKSAKATAFLLSISTNTVNTHVKNIMRKLDCNSQEGIIRLIDSHGDQCIYLQNHFMEKIKKDKYVRHMQTYKTKKEMSKTWRFALSGVLLFFGFVIYLYIPDLKIYPSNFTLLNKNVLLERKQLISKIDGVLSKQKGIKFAILSGIGGAGKTTLARLFLNLQNCEIKWELNAETKEDIFNSFLELANTLANTSILKKELSYIKLLEGREEKITSLMVFIASCLKKTKGWCLLFDNVEDFNFVKAYMPFDQKVFGSGSVLITTRNNNLKNIGYFNQSMSICVEHITEGEQLELFLKIVYDNDISKMASEKLAEIRTFLNYVPKFPLDVSATAYYIKNMNISLSDYLALTNIANPQFYKAQNQILEENVNYSSTRYGIITSTFNKILQKNLNFKKLLLFTCFVNSQNIPKDFLMKLTDRITSDDFLYNLQKHSLILDGGDNFSIHRSTQQIGFDYVLTSLSEEEKHKYFNEIIELAIQYVLTESRIKTINLLPHIESQIKNLINCGLYNSEMYKAKLLFALFVVSNTIRPLEECNNLAEKILNINNVEKYIGNKNMSILLSTLAFSYIHLSVFKKAEDAINKCLKVCRISKLYEIEAYCLALLARRYSEYGEMKKCLPLFEKAYAIIPKIDKALRSQAIARVNEQYYKCLSQYYVNKTEIQKAITVLLEALRTLEISELFHKRKNYDKEIPKFVATLRSALAGAYNCVEEYDKALECEMEEQAVYNQRRETGASSLIFESNNWIDYGYTLLRTQKVKEALAELTKAIDTKVHIKDLRFLFNALIYRSEANNRLKKFDDAYADCKMAIGLNEIKNHNHNFIKLLYIICYYNMAIAKYNQKQTEVALNHFSEFFKASKIFCQNFLEEDKLRLLNDSKIFEESNDIKMCLKKSLMIFKAIYGDNHSFVKNYASKNSPFFD